MYSIVIIAVGFSPILYGLPYATNIGEPFSPHEGLLSLQPMFPPKPFELSPCWVSVVGVQKV